MPVTINLIPNTNIIAVDIDGDLGPLAQIIKDFGLFVKQNKISPGAPTLTDLSKANLPFIEFDSAKMLANLARNFRGDAYFKRGIVVDEIKNKSNIAYFYASVDSIVISSVIRYFENRDECIAWLQQPLSENDIEQIDKKIAKFSENSNDKR